MHIESLLLCLILLAITEVVVNQSLPGCPNKCGDVEIPYPFGVGHQSGTGNKCFLEEETFSLSCDENSKLWHRNVEISSISVRGHMDMSMNVSRVCYDGSGRVLTENAAYLTTPAFTISSKENKFTSVGCDTYGYILGSQSSGSAYGSYATGCLTKCNTIPNEENGESCSGVGCCQVDIPQGMRNISITAYSFNDQTKSVYNNCSYAFVAKQGWFNFSRFYLYQFPFDKAPLVVDWVVSNDSCDTALTSSTYACTSNSRCVNSVYGYGYRCKCKPGFEGNPYHPDGCHDIDECTESTHDCISKDHCFNTFGSYECYCPRGYSGNGKNKEGGCQAPLWHNPLTKVLVGASVGSVALFVSVSWLFLVYQRRKLIKSKDNFFRQNGGYILQQQLSGKQASSLTAKIFTAQELKKATNNYHDSLIIGRGGFGTVYKGFLPDNRIVAIKKSKLVDQSQIEQFINEVIVLSQINHRNVVKLLGCCLETEIPLLVYEFVNNGTLFDYIHNKTKASDHITWETRLRIASEVAGALSYLHSAACIPIIHRDVKTSNILLDQTCTPKVSDFGASRLVPLDQTELATMVQGTFGYLDPEYMQTNQLTEKSDVYSFGVVLVELLTGKKALKFDGPEEERSLAMHFLSCLTQGRLFEVVEVGIVNEENKLRINEVAVLAARCLRLKGEERPSMKEVAMELEGKRMIGKHPWVKKDLNLEESQILLRDTFNFSECVDHSMGFRNTGWHSMLDHVLIDFDDGR
ncbi:putative wall-associated receptor kinase-like 16 [Senna tora]|uniref:Putative wall-associated receptor kinase-like 16 n=1 Tax=Senna tora TaxID=362788 RepID=A0A834WH24_9FABA|nr:putative wall-associated receptor kinase-like 16 [Senna tora]